MILLAVITLLAGGMMLATKDRRRFPCFAGGVAAIIAGGFTLSLPILDSMGAFGWIFLCGWIVSLPILLGCGIALIVIHKQDRSVLPALLLCALALATSIPPAIHYWKAAGLAVV